MTLMKCIVAGALGAFFLSACGGGGGNSSGAPITNPTPPPDESGLQPPTPTPAHYLSTLRFTTHQPDVLEQVGAHHAYAKGLTGRGVRIGIDDTIVDYTQSTEFGERVKLRDADGASLAYLRPLGDLPTSDVASCRRSLTCRIWQGDSEGDDEAPNRWVQQVVREDGWPRLDDSVFVVDEHYLEDGSIEQFYRWWEIPTPYGVHGSHGTIVASVAAGKNLGIAPEATIIPIARNLTDDQGDDAAANRVLQLTIQTLLAADRKQIDDFVASSVRDDYAKFDIINRSYGTRTSQLAVIDNVETANWYQTYLPGTWNALLQSDISDARKTMIVYAAGNDSDPVPGLGAALPYVFPEMRGYTLAVAATDPRTGIIADYSNRCGPLPQNWNAARHGRHYCLTAPGTVRGLVPDPNSPGGGTAKSGLTGTSYAAPIVSGALALLKEHFRGTRGNTAIVRRMIDTADRSGRYSDLRTYGAGHLDLEAALTPRGTLSAGPSSYPLGRSSLSAPAAYGSIARRAAHLELAVFDDHDFPFWVPVSALISDPVAGRSPIPRFEDAEIPPAPAPGLDTLNLQWTTVSTAPAGAGLLREAGWVAGFGPSSASVASRPPSGGWGYGLSFEKGSHLGSAATGAFRTNVQAGMVWTSHSVTHALSSRVSVRAAGTLAVNLPHYGADAMFRTGPSLLSAAEMRIGTPTTGIIFAQPLRAESGVGRFRLENGWMEGGRKLRDEHLVPLRPEAREFRLTVRHERQALDGTVAVEAGGAVNAGHVPGEREASIGLAYRMIW